MIVIHYIPTITRFKMQPSPIQLVEMTYLGIKVWPQPYTEETDAAEQPTIPFDFNGVFFSERIETHIVDDNKDDPKLYGVKLRIAIENKKGKIAPYDLDIEIAGLFEIKSKVPKEEREDMIVVNGCAVLYSAIRDQIMTITARCSRGVFILPTVNFLDKIKKETDVPPAVSK